MSTLTFLITVATRGIPGMRRAAKYTCMMGLTIPPYRAVIIMQDNLIATKNSAGYAS